MYTHKHAHTYTCIYVYVVTRPCAYIFLVLAPKWQVLLKHTILGSGQPTYVNPLVCLHLYSHFFVSGGELLMELWMDLLYKC